MTAVSKSWADMDDDEPIGEPPQWSSSFASADIVSHAIRPPFDDDDIDEPTVDVLHVTAQTIEEHSAAAFDDQLDTSRMGLPLMIKAIQMRTDSLSKKRKEVDAVDNATATATTFTVPVRRKGDGGSGGGSVPVVFRRNDPAPTAAATAPPASILSAWTQPPPSLIKTVRIDVAAAVSADSELTPRHSDKKVRISLVTNTRTYAEPTPTTVTTLTPRSKRIDSKVSSTVSYAAALTKAPVTQRQVAQPQTAMAATNESTSIESAHMMDVQSASTPRGGEVTADISIDATAADHDITTQPVSKLVDSTEHATGLPTSEIAKESEDIAAGVLAGEEKVKVLPPVLTRKQRLSQRQKQIDLGYRTSGYSNYITLVPKANRSRLIAQHHQDGTVPKRPIPTTPNKYQTLSKRCWDGLVRQWRRALHAYDEPPLQTSTEPTFNNVVAICLEVNDQSPQ